jgi:uncharacterized protein YijF (DUF1287 family)
MMKIPIISRPKIGTSMLIVFIILKMVWFSNDLHASLTHPPVTHNKAESIWSEKIKTDTGISNGIFRAALHFGKTEIWTYDPGYYSIAYPKGDVPGGGACTDVIIRVLRKNNRDLQKEIHEDMLAHFSAYPNKWGLTHTDANIDHRRVANIMKYFERKGYAITITTSERDYLPGDVVTWELSPGVTHIGIVLDKGNVFHNMGPTSRIESDFLFSHKIIGHYRLRSY